MESQQSIFIIPGMDCPVEEKLVRSALSGIPGISSLDFNLVQRKLYVRHDSAALPLIEKALVSLDMGAALQNNAETALPAEKPIPWKRLVFAAFLALLSEAAHFCGETGAGPLGDINLAGFSAWTWLSLILAFCAICISGIVTYKKGWQALKTFNLNINALMSVAVTCAVIIGQFPEAATVMVLFELSEAIEARSLGNARKAIRNLMELAPETVCVQDENNEWESIPAARANPGMIARVKPGERISLDGVVTKGQSSVNQAPITGESAPVEKKAGDRVFAGTINENGSFEYKITSAASDTTLARIIHAVEEAQATRAPVQKFVDVFARFYTPCVFLLAVLIAFLPPLLMGAGWHESIYKALVILIIGCPCALVISTPVSIVSGMAAATAKGILVKGGIFMEQGRLIRWLALDKTGTITQGRPAQTDFINLSRLPDRQIGSVAASLASHSDHPVSRAIAEKARRDMLMLYPVDDFRALPGEGSCGQISGEKWWLGSPRLLERLYPSDQKAQRAMRGLEDEGKTVVCLMDGTGPVALFAVADAIRPSSREAIAELKKLGVTPIMLTGDNQATAAAIAREAGIDEYYAQLLPEDKLKIVESLETRPGKTGMAGDGINDAPALARADISFAMAGDGTDTAIETADVALMDDDLRKIPRFMRLSRATFAILVQNIAMALGIKIVFFILALTGAATMWMAVFADVGAALLVVGNGLRALKK